MKAMLQTFGNRYVTEKAQGMIEYALIAAFICGIAAVVFAPDNSLWTTIQSVFTSVSTKATAAVGN